jgi:DNA polymerase-3 subunit gamma/tau
VKFVFCTTEPHRLPDTIHSRCQRFDFRRISTEDMVKRLKQICEKEGREAEPGALRLIARSSKGGMRDSETLLDQLTSYCGETITVADVEQALGALPRPRIFALLDHLAEGQADHALQVVHDALQEGKDIENLITQTLDHVRSLLLLSVCGKDQALLDETPDDIEELERQRKSFSVDSLLYISQVLWETLRKVKEGAQSRVPLELALVKLAQSDGLQPLTAVLERLQALEARLAGAPAPQPAPAASARGGTSAGAAKGRRSAQAASRGGEKKKRRERPKAKQPDAAPARARGPSSDAADYQAMAEARRKLEQAAADNPVVSEAIRILEGQVIKRET